MSKAIKGPTLSRLSKSLDNRTYADELLKDEASEKSPSHNLSKMQFDEYPIAAVDQISLAFIESQKAARSIDGHEIDFSDDMSICQSFWIVTKMAVPISFGLLLFLLINNINTYYIGSLNDAKLLAGVGMGNMLINVFCFAITQGLNGSIETFVSSSFGAGKFEECGIFLNRGKVICTIVLVPIFVLLGFSDRLLIAVD